MKRRLTLTFGLHTQSANIGVERPGRFYRAHAVAGDIDHPTFEQWISRPMKDRVNRAERLRSGR